MEKRELKFRIWNGLEMVYDITTGKFGTFYVNPEKGDGLNPEDTASLTVNTTKYHEGTPLMQFTGLIDKNSKEIKNLLLDEIIKRYQYKEGLYQYYTKNNSEIKKAVTLFNNIAEYNKILKI